MIASPRGFHAVDYIIFALILLTSTAIGLYHAFTGGKQRTTRDYFHGDGNLRTVPVALSMLVSFVSAILVLGTPAEMYTRGTQLTMRVLGYCLSVLLSSLLFVPLFYKLKVTSSFEYLEMRFQSKAVKLIGTLSMITGSIFYMGLVMYSPSTALEAVTGFPVWGSILACGVVATLYTTVGGMRAVVWTDVFQSIVMISGMLLIVIQGTIKVGGLQKVLRISEEGGRMVFFDFDPDPTLRLSFWSLIIGGMFSNLTVFGIGQSSVQRYCSLPTLKQAKRSLYLNIPGLLIVNILASLTGLVVYAYYADIGCDPLKEGYISNSNQLVPYFVMDVLQYPGVAGVFLAVLFSGALSSLSSSLNSLSAVTWQDMLQYFFKSVSENKRAFLTKLLVIFYGGIAMIVAFGADKIKGHVLQISLSFTGATSGPTLGMFLLGAFFPAANATGALVGCCLSFAFSLWLAIGTFITKPFVSTTLPTSTEFCSNSSTSHWIQNYTSGLVNQTMLSVGQEWNYNVFNATWQAEGELTTSSSSGIEQESQLSGVEKMYCISFLWYSAIGASITVIIGLVVSVIVDKISGYPSLGVNPDFIVPVYDSLCCWVPSVCRRRRMEVELGQASEGELEKRNDHAVITRDSPPVSNTKVRHKEDSGDCVASANGSTHPLLNSSTTYANGDLECKL